MKPIGEFRKDRRLQIKAASDDGGTGWVTVRGKTLLVVFSWGGGWDHVSVSTNSRCPTWDEMCAVKEIFFSEDECCVEYHPRKSDYVNVWPYCLHIWKPQREEIPTPPRMFV